MTDLDEMKMKLFNAIHVYAPECIPSMNDTTLTNIAVALLSTEKS